jgi:hypothetical protein
MGFDPKAYLASKKSEESAPFDPKAYLAEKESPAQPPIPKGQETLLGGLLTKQTAQNWVNALPTIGALGGGAVGAGAGLVGAGGALSVPGAVAGAGLGAYGGKYLQGALETALDLPNKPGTRVEAHLAPLKEALVSATGEGVGLNIANKIKGNPLRVSAADLAKVKALAEKGQAVADKIPAKKIPGLLELSEEMFANTPKPNADEISSAAGRLGTEPTPGMLTSNKNLQNIEQVLSERPTIAGELVRRRYSPLKQAMQSTAEEIGSNTAISPNEYGAEAQKALMSKIGEQLDPLKTSFNEIAQSTSRAPIDSESAQRAASGLLKSSISKGEGLPANEIMKKYAGMLEQAKDAETVQNIVSAAKQSARDLRGTPEGIAAQKAASSGERLLRRGLLKAGKSGAGETGVEEAKGLIQQIRQTKSGYRDLTKQIDSSLGQLKLGTSSPGEVIRRLDEMPSEKVAERLFNAKNVDAINNLKSYSPEAFEAVRQNRLNQIVEKSLSKGKVDPSKLLRNMKGLPKEVKELLVGSENVSKLKDVETLTNSLPDIVGPSGTPRGLAWHNFDPRSIGTELSDALKLRALRTGTLPTTARAIQKSAGFLQSPAGAPSVMLGTQLGPAAGYNALQRIGLIGNQRDR